MFSPPETPTPVIVVRNHSSQPLHLEKSILLGHVESVYGLEYRKATVRILIVDDRPTACAQPPAKERGEEEINELTLKPDDWSSEEGRKLRAIVAEHWDTFALNPSELGFTDIVQHAIDTGASQPV